MKTRNKLHLPNIIAFSLLFFILISKTYSQGSPESKFNSSLQDFNVSTYTGSAMVNIPIYTFSEGGITIPISLSCNTSGIKVDEKASFVGLGWTLNAGGMISRMVMGSPDEGSFNEDTYIKGYYEGNGYYSTNVYDDHEPDQFFMNVGGTSIRFMFAENGKVYTMPASDVKIEPHFTRISYSGQPTFYRFTDFTVTMPDGTKYIFGTKQEVNNYAYNEAIEKSYSGDVSQGGTLGASSLVYRKNFITRAWMLTKIISPNGFSVDLDYSHDRFKNINMPNYQAHSNSSCGYEYIGNTSIVNEYVDAPVLEAITGTNIKIEFRKQNTYDCSYKDEITGEDISQSCSNPESFKRDDLIGWSTNNFYGRILKQMRVLDKTENSFVEKLTYNFTQSYFRPSACDNYVNPISGNSSTYQFLGASSYRLRLDKISFPDGQELSFDYYQTLAYCGVFPGTTISATYKTRTGADTYNTDNQTIRGDYAKDHWGYFNGNQDNDTNDKRFGTGECQNGSCSVRNRTASYIYSPIHSLKTITSNRGTETTFEYELHDANNYKDANGTLLPIGGNRIAKIISKDLISGISTVKKYQYKSFNNTALSSGFLIMKPVYRFSYSDNYGTASGKVFGFNDYLYLSALSQLSRPYISYRNITESIYSTTGDVSTVEADNRLLATNKFTYNQNETEIDACNYGNYPNQLTPKIDYDSQNLTKSESYTKDNKLASVMEMEYGLSSTGQVISGKRYLYLNDIAPIESQKTNYSFTVYHAYLKRQVQRNYDYSGNNYTEDEVKYFYKNDTEIPVTYRATYPGIHYQVVKTTTKDSKGNIIENWNKYAGDFNFGVTSTTVQDCQTNYVEQLGWTYDCQNVTTSVAQTPTDDESKAIKQLLDRNMIVAPIETFTKRNNKIINASYINYHLESSPKAPLPKERYTLRYFPLDSLTEAKWTGASNQPNGVIEKSSNYVLSNTITTYNVYGFPTESKVNFGAKTTMTYQTNNLLPYQTTNASGTPEVQTSTATFDSPVFGVSKQTAPNGVFTTNVYEVGTGRLIKVNDRFGNIIKHIEYIPKGQ